MPIIQICGMIGIVFRRFIQWMCTGVIFFIPNYSLRFSFRIMDNTEDIPVVVKQEPEDADPMSTEESNESPSEEDRNWSTYN